MTDTNTATNGSGRQVEKPENTGSSPAIRTNISKDFEDTSNSAQNSAESKARNMKFPKVIKHRRYEATIYGNTIATLAATPSHTKYSTQNHLANGRLLATLT